MNLINHIKTIQKSYFGYSIIPLILIFLPIFCVHFGAHTDGFYIITKKGDWLGDPEGATMFMQGRPISAILNSFLGWFINNVEHFTIIRIIVFTIKIFTSYLIYTLCRQINLAYGWSALIAFYFILIPSNIINVIWIANGVPESVSLLCATASYIILNKYTNSKNTRNLISSAILFLIALLMYQPMATITFGLIFLKLLFWKDSPWAIIRKRIFKEILFYSIILLLYWLLIKLLILPFGKNILGLAPPTNSIYQMNLVKNLGAKYILISDLLKRSLIGTWDILLYKNNRLEWFIILASFSFASLTIFLNKKNNQHLTTFHFFQKILIACSLFLLANSPSLMAANYTDIIGYRTFASSSLMGLCLIICFYKYCYLSFPNTQFRIATITLFSTLFLSILLVASWTINQSVRNYLREYSYIDKIASHIDYHKIKKIVLILNRPQDTVIEYDLPGELGLMTTSPSHVQYIFNKYSSGINNALIINEAFLDWPLYTDEYTKVIDLTTLRKEKNIYAKPGKRIEIETSSNKEQEIFVEEISGGNTHPIFLFLEKGIVPNMDTYWQIKPGDSNATITFKFTNKPEMLINYKLIALCVDNNNKPSNFYWQLEGSLNARDWINLASAQGEDSAGNIQENYSVTSPNNTEMKYLRFNFRKENPQDLLIIKNLQLFSF